MPARWRSTPAACRMRCRRAHDGCRCGGAAVSSARSVRRRRRAGRLRRDHAGPARRSEEARIAEHGRDRQSLHRFTQKVDLDFDKMKVSENDETLIPAFNKMWNTHKLDAMTRASSPEARAGLQAKAQQPPAREVRRGHDDQHEEVRGAADGGVRHRPSRSSPASPRTPA